jgi:hypothetical protein
MLHRVAVVKTDVSEEFSASIIRVNIGELGTTLAVTSNRRVVALMMGTLNCYETSVLTRATWRNIPEDAILHVNMLILSFSYTFRFCLIYIYIYIYIYMCVCVCACARVRVYVCYVIFILIV